MISNHLFTQMPPLKTALLALSILMLSTIVASHVLPRETNSPESQLLSRVVSWPILASALATPAPAATSQSLRQQFNTVCGYIGGNPDLPATCIPGSHCAVDVEHGAVGCCPDEGSCKRGIFTGCIDRNSGPQTVADPYIFTCRGPNVCYRNQFAGGYFQFGCGTASALATTVLASASGQPVLELPSISARLTATPTPLSEPTSLRVEPTESPNMSSIRSTYTTAWGFQTMSNHPQPSITDGAAAPSSWGSSVHSTPAIIGGTLGGVALIFTLALLGFLLWLRKSKTRGSSLVDAPDVIKQRSMAPGHTHFEPYTSRQGVAEIKPSADMSPMSRNSDNAYTQSPVLENVVQQPAHLDTVKDANLRNAEHSQPDSDRVPLTRGLGEFAHEFNSASEVVEPDSDADTQNSETYPGPRRGSDGGILWQQNRRRSRNLVWM
ncbi:hypothetical protein E4U43_008428 [Claviceps pusilla]|uniref:Mid2 domain-containing protein n=1 Tax=Claviceps pusilla TaxID=123648 RepID=A0A9P7NIY0_9HYPO|nr:hypothetical protein E4U43_008428 [Claviceps pusilla]